MKKLLSLLLAVVMLFSLTISALATEAEEEAGAVAADGVEEGRWYTAAVKNVMEKGIMNGTGNGFEPEGVVTRGTVVQTLYNMEGRPEVNNKMATFPDAQGKWYEDAVRWAEQEGIAEGNGSGFNGDAALTRAELVTFLSRYGALKGNATDNEVNLLEYVDGELVVKWAIPHFQWAVGAGVIRGKSGNRLAPTDAATRAELAQILTNYTDIFYPESSVIDAEPSLTPPADRSVYPSDAAYVNFREVAVGSIPSGVLYRSSSPIDPNQGDRRFVADALLKEAEVVTVVNASDCRFKFRGFEGYDNTHYATLGEKNQVALNMGHDYPSDAFLEDMYNGLEFLTERPGPYLIHGTEGVERTGYVCMVLEALMGASKEELLADYLRSYEDYYRLDTDSENYKAAQTQAVSNLLIFTGAEDEAALETLDLAQATRAYLLEQVKLSEEQIDLLVSHLSGN